VNTVLEVGAGLGSNTLLLCNKSFKRWVCLEPDTHLFKAIIKTLTYHGCCTFCKVIKGTILDLSSDDVFDTILYLDVLEHVENDQAEFFLTYKHLTDNGKIIVLAIK